MNRLALKLWLAKKKKKNLEQTDLSSVDAGAENIQSFIAFDTIWDSGIWTDPVTQISLAKFDPHSRILSYCSTASCTKSVQPSTGSLSAYIMVSSEMTSRANWTTSTISRSRSFSGPGLEQLFCLSTLSWPVRSSMSKEGCCTRIFLRNPMGMPKKMIKRKNNGKHTGYMELWLENLNINVWKKKR